MRYKPAPLGRTGSCRIRACTCRTYAVAATATIGAGAASDRTTLVVTLLPGSATHATTCAAKAMNTIAAIVRSLSCVGPPEPAGERAIHVRVTNGIARHPGTQLPVHYDRATPKGPCINAPSLQHRALTCRAGRLSRQAKHTWLRRQETDRPPPPSYARCGYTGTPGRSLGPRHLMPGRMQSQYQSPQGVSTTGMVQSAGWSRGMLPKARRDALPARVGASRICSQSPGRVDVLRALCATALGSAMPDVCSRPQTRRPPAIATHLHLKVGCPREVECQTAVAARRTHVACEA